jgi:hypothetical protein
VPDSGILSPHSHPSGPLLRNPKEKCTELKLSNNGELRESFLLRLKFKISINKSIRVKWSKWITLKDMPKIKYTFQSELKGDVNISLLQAVEAHRVARGRGSHIT